MKRIIYSCFLLTLIFLSKNILAQPFNFTITPVAQCYSPVAGTNSCVAAVTQTQLGAFSYTWAVGGPTGPGCTATQTVAVSGGTMCNFTFPCCGDYTITCYPCDNLGVPINGQQIFVVATVECPVTPTISAGSASICAGNTVNLTALGGATWTWTPGGQNGSVITVTPGATTSYTANGQTVVGCSLTGVTSVTVQTLNVFITPPSQTVCPGTTVTLNANTSAGPISTGITYQWYEESPPNPSVTLGTGVTEVVTPTALTIYTVNVFVSTCSASATNTITLGPAFSMTATASSVSVCATETVVLTATSSATSYTWTQVTPPTATLNTNPATFIGPGVYVVQGENNVPCLGAPETVTVFLTNFTPTVTASSASVCANETFTLVGSGGTPNVYSWGTTVPSPSSICGPCSATLTTTQTVATTYSVGAISPGGCINGQTITVGITPPATVSVTASAASVCATSPVTLSASGATLYTFVSSTTGTISASSTTSVVVDTPTANTTYTIYGTSGTGFCGGQATITVNMITGGTLTLTTTSSNPTLCVGQSSSLTASGAVNYVWTPTISLSNPATGTFVVASPSVTTIYTVTGDNGGGCTAASTVVVTVIPKPVVTINATAWAICPGYTSTLTAQGANSYVWTGSTFAIPVNQASISVSPGNYSVIGFAVGGSCQSDPVYTTVIQSPPLVITTSIAPIQGTTCIAQNYPYKLSFPVNLFAFGASNYVWFPYNPAYVTYSLGPTTTVRPPTSTCYTVTGSTSVCSGTALICVNVIPQFTMDVVPPLPAICLNDSIKLSIVNIQQPLAVGPPSAFEYYWNDPPTSPPPSITAANTQTIMSFPQVTSTYTVEVKDSRKCVSLPRLVTVTVLPQPLTYISLPIINNVPTNTVCFVGDRPSAPDNKLDLTANNTNVGLPFGVTPTYTWLGSNNPQSVVTPSNQPMVTIIAPHRVPSVVVFTVITGYNGIPGCKRKDTISVRVIDCRPVTTGSITFVMDVPQGDTLCSRDCITFIATTDTLAGGPQTYTWTFEGGLPLTSNEKAPVVCYDLPSPPGRGWNVILKVSNPYPVYENPPGSTAVTSFYNYVKVVDYPNVTIVPPGQRKSDTTIKFSQSIVLTATNALTYTWSPHYSISSITGSVVTVNPTKTTQYIVTGHNSTRCYSSDTLNVKVIEDCGDMYVPNAFSPNGDEVNDVLTVRGVCLETLTFMIFNRWGEKVFETNDVTLGWDGTFHGEKLNTGVFVYRLEGKTYEGKGFSAKGNITLIR